VIDIAEECKKSNSRHLQYLREYELSIDEDIPDLSIGDGHSARWKTRRELKGQPINLGDWQAYHANNPLENVPWTLKVDLFDPQYENDRKEFDEKLQNISFLDDISKQPPKKKRRLNDEINIAGYAKGK